MQYWFHLEDGHITGLNGPMVWLFLFIYIYFVIMYFSQRDDEEPFVEYLKSAVVVFGVWAVVYFVLYLLYLLAALVLRAIPLPVRHLILMALAILVPGVILLYGTYAGVKEIERRY